MKLYHSCLTKYNKIILCMIKTKFDNVVVDAIKLILLNYNNFSIAKIVANKIERAKSTLSRLPTNTKLIPNKLVLINSIH